MSEPEVARSKGEDDFFRDWESYVFGYGYGSGEPHTLPPLKVFLSTIAERSYDHKVLERELTPTVAWLLINTLCSADILEYGTSPRFGWLTPQGESLKRYVDARKADDLICIVCDAPDEDIHCYPEHCNCIGPKCANPFWVTK